MADYYETLGVSRNATDDEIKKAYRKLSRKYHPDIAGPEFEDKFKEVNTAYDVLSDPEKRSMFDQGVDPMSPNAGAGAGFGSADFGDIFSTFFGGGFGSGSGPIPRTQPGRDSLASLNVELKTAVFGNREKLNVTMYAVCDTCHGNGSADGSAPVTCPQCNGSGSVQRVVRTMLGQMMSSQPCERCEGHGTIIENPCASCLGQGRVRKQRTITVSVPAGVEDGTRLRLQGQGEVGEGGGSAGDLYVDISVRPDETFTRDGSNLHCWIRVPMTWAVLGHETHISTFDGDRTLSIPAGSQPEDTITLDNLGVTKLNREERGNLIVHLEVSIPKKLSNQEKKLISDFEGLNKESQLKDKPQQSSKSIKQNRGFFEKLRHAFS
ncbi:molecular chaperone DnaJ [Alloscardovia theropitheci]|uniref:Chaperone protein DnaJ n=1 Tax=Alloscardovia theropitheci TaxID=2496842 RepID=A0A4R0R0Y8_9BIFI|nr:molecular chaperone DnaJ [Alloscardovia theropitheci]TCD54766.1 molecular chaperone DnaJ [Alloscardovia theropitheci]